jgi:hypothetical protein
VLHPFYRRRDVGVEMLRDYEGRLHGSRSARVTGGRRRRRYVYVVEDHGRRRWGHRGINAVVVPSYPQALETTVLAVCPIRQTGECEPDVSEDAGRHVPDEGFEVDHAGYGESHEGPEHLAALLGDHVLLDPGCGAVAQGELLGELGIVVAKAAPRDGVRCRASAGAARDGALVAQAVLVGKAVVARDQRREAVGEGIDARARLRVGALIGPHNVEARVDARHGEAVEGRVAERERGEIVGVRELRGQRSVGRQRRAAQDRAAHLVYDVLEDVHGQVEQPQRASGFIRALRGGRRAAAAAAALGRRRPRAAQGRALGGLARRCAAMGVVVGRGRREPQRVVGKRGRACRGALGRRAGCRVHGAGVSQGRAARRYEPSWRDERRRAGRWTLDSAAVLVAVFGGEMGEGALQPTTAARPSSTSTPPCRAPGADRPSTVRSTEPTPTTALADVTPVAACLSRRRKGPSVRPRAGRAFDTGATLRFVAMLARQVGTHRCLLSDLESPRLLHVYKRGRRPSCPAPGYASVS